MFAQVTPSVCWTSFCDAQTLVTVGTDAVAMLYHNIVTFFDVKTKERSYFKGDNAQTTAGIALLAGHHHFPYFAVAETVLRPAIYVLKYPEMEKLTVIPPGDSPTYLSLHMSDHGYLAALSGPPNYTLRLWNYRNGVHFADVETRNKCSKYALYFTTTSEALVIQYSEWSKQIFVWELCLTGEQYDFHELSTVQLGKDFEKSKLFHITYSDDGNAYVINDYGTLMSIDPGLFSLKTEWTVPDQNLKEPKIYRLFYNKSGLIILQSTRIYFVKRRQNDWILDWQIEDTGVELQKIVSDYNCNIYATSRHGNVYYVDHVGDTGGLRELFTTNAQVLDYCLFKNVKEEILVLLTFEGEVRLVELLRMNLISKTFVEQAIILTAHNTTNCIAVATKMGKVHFISFENRNAPIELAVVQVEEASIAQLKLFDITGLVLDKLNGLHLLNCNFKKSEFFVTVSLEPERGENWRVLEVFLVDANRALVFVSFDTDYFSKFCTQIWVYSWQPMASDVHCRIFDLPYKYRGFTLLSTATTDNIEFAGIRGDSFIYDVLSLQQNSSLCILYSIMTTHFGHINSISGSRNIITSATQGIIYHFRAHKRSKSSYIISRALLNTYQPRLCKLMDDCFNSKYLLVLYANGYMIACRLPLLVDALTENLPNEDFPNDPIASGIEMLKEPKRVAEIFIREITEEDRSLRKEIKADLEILAKDVNALINYDISVTGQSHGVFRKFCLNTSWLNILTLEARYLCDKENNFLLESIDDQARIRDWILNLIQHQSNHFSIHIRSMFSHISLENYAMHAPLQELLNKFDYFRFYDIDLMDDELSQRRTIVEEVDEEDFFKVELKHYIIEPGTNVFEHVMSKDFEMQDINTVTFYQMYNEDAKLQTIIIDALKYEFNKEFSSLSNYKQEVINFVLDTNEALRKIYNNMNCMLCLLKMQQFTTPELSLPQYSKDEQLEKIMTVDDSEIVAINRRRKIAEKAAYKSGRMLLWPKEYWVRAIMLMMDGVLEKLWEEEIKKTPALPEFILRKNPHEYNIEEQRFIIEYENKLRILEEDRQKYLKILKDQEIKTLSRKKHFIMKLNERLAETAILKLKYDFAVKHERLRLLNIKVSNFKRIECRNRINAFRKQMDKIVAYVGKYGKLLDFWERSFNEVKAKLENQTYRDKQLERQFKGQFLNTIPAHLTHELNKIFKRRPKLPIKSFGSANACFEVAERIVSKKHQKFPLPQELLEFLATIDNLDDAQNCPNQLDQKHWENFIKIRRQKLESELRLRGVGFQLLDAQNKMNFFTKELNVIKNTRSETSGVLMEAMEDYFDTAQNQTLEIVLEMGQVELGNYQTLECFRNCILMHVDDINDVNELIREAGRKKLNSMQRVAFFRRQVIYKEWEHKVVRGNIEYLEYILKLVNNCKVTFEFLEVLRNWDQVKDNKVSTSVVGSIEQTLEKRREAARSRLVTIYKEIDRVRGEILLKRRANRIVNHQIAEVRANVTLLGMGRDTLAETKLERERKERFAQLKAHRNLIEVVRRDYIHVMELSTILELQRLRTYPTLGSAPQCAYID